MKRTISLIILTAFIFTLATLPSFALENVDKYAINAIQVLKQLELAEFDINSLNENITRKDFIKVVCKLTGLNESIKVPAGTYIFSDIDASSEYAEYIYLAKQMKLVSGFSDGAFYPDGNISTLEAVTVLIRLLGYGYKADALNGYPNGYISITNDLKLLKNTDGKYKSEISIKDLSVILLNAINTNIMSEANFGSDKVEFQVKDGVTLLSQNFNIYLIEGIVSGIDITKLVGDSDVPPCNILINGITVQNAKISGNDYLGYYVSVYYKKDSGKNILKCIIKKEDKNTEIIVNLKDIENIINYKVVAENGNGKSIEYAYLKTAPIIYNGVSTTMGFNMDLINNKQGNITLLDNNNDKKADVVFINAYDNYVVSAKSADNNIYHLYDNSRKINLDLYKDDPYVLIYNEFGEEISFGSIQKNSVVSVYESLSDAPQKLIKAYVSNNKISGRLDMIESLEDFYRITLEGQAIDLSVNTYENVKRYLKIGSVITVGIDVFGKGAYVKGSSTSELEYGYIIDVKKENKFDGRVVIKYLNTDGIFETKYVSDSLKIDDILYKNSSDIILTVLHNSAKAIESNIADNCYAQIVKYTIDENSEIDYIDTVLFSPDGTLGSINNLNGRNNLYFIKGNSLNYKINARCLGGKIIIPKNAAVFRIPSPASTEIDYRDETMYELTTSDYFVDDKTYTVNSFYSSEDSIGAELLTVINDGSLQFGSASVLYSYFIGSSNVVNNEGAVVYKIRFIQNGKEQSMFAEEDLVYTDEASSKSFKISELNCGDIIRYSESKTGYIGGFELLYSIKEDKFYKDLGENNDIYAARRLVKAYVYCVYNDGFTFKVTDNVSDLTDISDLESIIYSQSYPIVIYDSSIKNENNRLKLGTYNDLLGYKTSGADCSKVIIQQRYSQCLSIYIIK